MCRITFRQETVKRLKEELEKAYVRGDKQAVRRLSVLLMIGQRMSLARILSVWNVSAQTVYNWLHEFVRGRWASLKIKKGPGRRPASCMDRSRTESLWVCLWVLDKYAPDTCACTQCR